MSSLAAALLGTVAFSCGKGVESAKLPGASVVALKPAAPPEPAKGPLRVHAANPRYFGDGSGRVVYLTGSHTWTSFMDIGYTDPPPSIDYAAFLDWLVDYRHNFMRLWVFETAKGAPWAAEDFWYTPLPYLRTGPGAALDGKPKFDLEKWNPDYFTRLRERVDEARKSGIYVAVMLFNGWSISKKNQGKENAWTGHPFHRDNNVNGIDGDANGNEEGEEAETLQVPAITALQEAYARKVIDDLNDLDNVLWEITNEANGRSVAWQYHMIRFIKEYEAGKPKQHPVGMTFPYPEGTNKELFESPADWISPNDTEEDPYMEDPPASNGKKVVVTDTDHLWGAFGGTQAWVWKSFTRGLNPIFMDNHDGSVFKAPPFDPQWDPVRRAMGYTRWFAEQVDLASMTPRRDLASTGYCLANPVAEGAEYLVYLPKGGQVTVDLSAAKGELAIEWFDPAQGVRIESGSVAGGDEQSFAAPFEGDAVLFLK